MAQIFVPTSSVEDWKRLLAQPDLHWKAGFSAMTLARSWEDAAKTGFPPLENALGFASPCPNGVRYQLLHRTVSALRIAQDFAATSAVMLVQSFSPTDKWHADFTAFAALFGVAPIKGSVVTIGSRDGVELYIGWCTGAQSFRAEIAAPGV